jgi:quinolinate synthase
VINDINAELIKEISELKIKRNAIIMAHNYQPGEVQDIADYTGDSLELARLAADVKGDVIVLCGVDFMAETAAILSPEKTVLLPEGRATCPMANMVTAAALREKKAEMPDAAVVCYVNTTAEVKAESDICCTSSNGVAVVKSLPEENILFVPDENLGHYIGTQLNDKNMILWPGYCPVHVRITTEDIHQARREYPGAPVIVHPECRPEVIALADRALSTGRMLVFARESEAPVIIIGTEIGIIHQLRKINPKKRFIPASLQAICPNMKLTTLGKVRNALRDMTPVISVPEDIRVKAREAVVRMLAVTA